LKKLFTSDKFFLIMVLCGILGGLAYAAIAIFAWNYAIQSQLVLLLRLVCVLALYISYKKHSKNVMKGMLGALLMAQMITAILYFSEITIAADNICVPIYVILSALLFINHFVINSNRKASPVMITINQIVILLLTVNNTVWGVTWIIAFPNAITFFSSIAVIIGFAGMASVIVCVESRLDAYRLDREAAGWTEEKGYPKGYVHEYEKK